MDLVRINDVVNNFGISSRTLRRAESLDGGNMEHLFIKYGFTPTPGLRNCFYRKEPKGEWVMLMKIPDDYENTTEYIDEYFPGGLFAIASCFMEDLEDTFMLLRDWINKSEYYELDAERELKASQMIEELIPWDIANRLNRYQQDIFIPIKSKEGKEKK